MQYETTFAIDSLQKSEDMQNTVAKLENFIKNNGGAIIAMEEWGKKRLAYEINRKQYGTYFHILFEGPATLPALLEKEYRLQEAILRFLTVKADPRLLKKRQKQAEDKEKDAAAPPAESAVRTVAESKTENETAEVAETESPAPGEAPEDSGTQEDNPEKT